MIESFVSRPHSIAAGANPIANGGSRKIRNLAFVGCGFVADLYAGAFSVHPELSLRGVFDIDVARRNKFAAHYKTQAYATLDELLADSEIDLILNLTNPKAHYEVSRACLLANKHVYSEKPLALQLDNAAELVELARMRGLMLSGAPCSLLSETAQTLWKAVRENEVGSIRAVYAELDDGMLHRMPYERWVSESGAPWPYQDEFEVGNTLEHVGYYLTWLTAFFGPVVSVTSFGSVQVTDKRPDEPLQHESADLSVACLKFDSGMVARLTCSIIGPHNHQLQIIGDDGVFGTDDCWFYRSPVWIRRRLQIRRRVLLTPWRRILRLVGVHSPLPKRKGSAQMDWLRGIADMAESVESGRPHRLSAEFALHNCEVMLAIDAGLKAPGHKTILSRFDPIEPMPWSIE